MSSNTWTQLLIVQQIDGTAVSNTTSETSVLPGAAKFNLPANLLQIGTKLRLRAGGRISTVVTTPGNITWRVKFGSIIVFDGGAIAQNTTAQTNASWKLEIELTCRAIGASAAANFFGIGEFKSRAVIGSAAAAAGGVGVWVMPDTSPGVGTGFDSTISNVIDLAVLPSVANASNSVRCDSYDLALCN